MKTILLPLLLLAAPLARALAQDDAKPAPAGPAAEKEETPGTKLARAWPEETYVYLRGGNKVGTWTMRNAVQRKEGEPEVVKLEDVMQLDMGGTPVTFEIHTKCRGDAIFTPSEVWGTMKQGPNAFEFRGRFTTGLLTGNSGERIITSALPPGTTVDMAAFRIVSRMPQKLGAEQAFHVVEVEPMSLSRDWKVTCKGPETLTFGETEVETWRYERTAPDKAPMSIWMGADRRLVKAAWDGTKTLTRSDLSEG